MLEIDGPSLAKYLTAKAEYEDALSKVGALQTVLARVSKEACTEHLRHSLEENLEFPFSTEKNSATYTRENWPSADELVSAFQRLWRAVSELESSHQSLPDVVRREMRLPTFL